MTDKMTHDTVLRAQLERFPRLHSRRLHAFAMRGRVFTDLIFAFPAFAFALATGYGRREDRQVVEALLLEGQSMLALADLFGLPRWMRKLPPEAFQIVLPDLGEDPAFHRRLGDLVPGDPLISARWLRWVAIGRELAGEEFALWLARQKVFGGNDGFWRDTVATRQALEPLALYAWYSSAATGEAVRYLARPWHPKIGFGKAVAEAQKWIDDIKLSCAAANDSADLEPWFPNWRRGGIRIVALMSQKELSEEGLQLDHCVATYGGKVKAGQCCIYSVRKGAKRLATVELVRRPDNGRKAEIEQMSAKSNNAPARTARRYVEKWFAQNADERLPDVPMSSSSFKRWRKMWHPFMTKRAGAISPLLADRWSRPGVFDKPLDDLAKLDG